MDVFWELTWYFKLLKIESNEQFSLMACFANFNFQGILFLKPISSLEFLVIQIALMILLEGF